jgi:hemerythrin-like domain-containing protein
MMELSALQQEFLDDHRRLTNGLKRILDSVERDDLRSAAEQATELDADAGAHMAFEEEVFYPQLGRIYGQELVDRMLAEHERGQRAIRRLLDLSPGETLDEQRRRELVEDLNVALSHVMSCGSMLSELGTGEAAANGESLKRLRQLRVDGERWTDRSYFE